MLLSDLGEFGFIDEIAKLVDPAEAGRVVVGIGDDAAVLDLGGPDLTVVTPAAMLEGQHCELAGLAPAEVSWRAGAAALSDLAAMGARPVAVVASVGLPPSWPAERGREWRSGLAGCAQSVGATLAGGDCAANAQVVLDVVAVGTVASLACSSGVNVARNASATILAISLWIEKILAVVNSRS